MVVVNLARINLLITAIIFFIYGLPPILDPAGVASDIGLQIRSPSGAVSVRAIYGGYLIGAALLFILAALRRPYLKAGLYALLVLVASILIVRVAGLAIEHDHSFDQLSRTAMETISVVATATLILCFPKYLDEGS